MNSRPDPGSEEALARAREIVPLLRERAQKCEDARMLLPENEKLLHEAGLFRYHQPKRFGGMELPFVAQVDLVAELARGCPSTAWNVGNLGCHRWGVRRLRTLAVLFGRRQLRLEHARGYDLRRRESRISCR